MSDRGAKKSCGLQGDVLDAVNQLFGGTAKTVARTADRLHVEGPPIAAVIVEVGLVLPAVHARKCSWVRESVVLNGVRHSVQDGPADFLNGQAATVAVPRPASLLRDGASAPYTRHARRSP